jgi:hypothetical protein
MGQARQCPKCHLVHIDQLGSELLLLKRPGEKSVVVVSSHYCNKN